MELKDDRDTAYNAILEPATLHSLRQEQLWKLIKALSDERKIRYVRHRQRKYGNMNKGFSKEEIHRFFGTPMHPSARMAFLTMLFLGLRIGEVVKIKQSNLDLVARRLYLHTEKAGTNDTLFLHDAIYAPLTDWIEEHQSAITAHEGFIFPAGKANGTEAYTSPHWLRKEFRRVCIASDIDRVYATSDERTGRATRHLHRFTTHSLRHTFATAFYRKTKDLLLTSKALRHTDMKSTTTYVHADQSELDMVLASDFLC